MIRIAFGDVISGAVTQRCLPDNFNMFAVGYYVDPVNARVQCGRGLALSPKQMNETEGERYMFRAIIEGICIDE